MPQICNALEMRGSFCSALLFHVAMSKVVLGKAVGLSRSLSNSDSTGGQHLIYIHRSMWIA